jgi:hypothetical protein
MNIKLLATLMAVALGFAVGGASAQSVNLQQAQTAEQETQTLPGAIGAEEAVAEARSDDPDQRIPAV